MFYPAVVVQAGTYKILKNQKKMLKANLGTCIGVAIWDEKNKVGGILHTLLSEPYSTYVDIPEKYASTGLPKFIEELVKEGADLKNLNAAVAGGGFIEPPDSMDIYINIGGKTADKVEDILKKYSVKIKKWETGGFMSSSLSLNMENFEAGITPFLNTLDEISPAPEKIVKDKVLDNIGKIKPIPQVILKIIQMLNNSSNSLKDIAFEIKKDQVISAKTIKICNSAAYNRPYPVSTIDEAILQLGEKNIMKCILENYLSEIFSMSERGYSLCKGGLFHHSIATAMISEELAEYSGTVKTDLAYTAGLLHDIGKILLDQSIYNIKPFFYRYIINNNIDVTDAEKSIMDTDHCEAGELIAEKWFFPENIKNVLKNHHRPDKEDSLSTIVHISDIISSWFLTGIIPETSRLNISFAHLENLNLKEDDLMKFMDRISIKKILSMIPVQITDEEKTINKNKVVA